MNRIPGVALVAVVAFAPTPAFADWESTHWGDSVETVIASVGGDAKSEQGKKGNRVLGQDLRASRTGDFSGVPARWEFFFDQSGGLSVVKISPRKGEDCAKFVADLRSSLGEPASDDIRNLGIMNSMVWNWAVPANNMKIMVAHVDGLKVDFAPCHVVYQPFKSAEVNPNK